MSTLATHAAMGLLLGLALRLPARQLPFAMLLAAAPDLDHLELAFLRSRASFHNLFFVAALPAFAYAAVAWRGLAPTWHRLLAGAPLLVTSHVLLDLLPLENYGSGGRVALLYPLQETTYKFDMMDVRYLDPTAWSTFTILLLLLAGLAGLVVLHLSAARPERPSQLVPFSLAWVVLLPAIVGAGIVVPSAGHPNASLAIEWARLDLAEGRLTASVLHAGGDSLRPGSVTLKLIALETPVHDIDISRGLTNGERMTFLGIVNDARSLKFLSVALVNETDDVTYAKAIVQVRRAHAPANVTLESATVTGDSMKVAMRIEGDATLPAGAFRVTALQGSLSANATSPPLALPTWWNATLAGPFSPSQPASLRVASVDDGHAYLATTVPPPS